MEIKKNKWIISGILILSLVVAGCTIADKTTETNTMETDPNAQLETAVFAGGCFCCMESGIEAQEGVIEVISGYTGGHEENSTY